jgi:hypothetical protein
MICPAPDPLPEGQGAAQKRKLCGRGIDVAAQNTQRRLTNEIRRRSVCIRVSLRGFFLEATHGVRNKASCGHADR